MKIKNKQKIFVPLTNDIMFKYIFGTTKHKRFIIDFISEILSLTSEEFIDAKITNSVKLDKDTVENEYFEVDVNIETKDGQIYNLEMQQIYNIN